MHRLLFRRARSARVQLAALALAALFTGACAKTNPTPGGAGDPCLANQDCAGGFTCSGGRCVLPANLGGCEPGRLRCNGSDVEVCSDDGLAWDLSTTCATGCAAGACKPQSCTPGARRCDGDASEQCTPVGDTWALVQECPAHCDASTGLCLKPVCTPFGVTCNDANTAVLTCDSFGAAQTPTPCASGQQCDNGRCVTRVCTPGTYRCDSGASEFCALDGESWTLVQVCPGLCQAGVCTAPICTPNTVTCSADAKQTLTCDAVGATQLPADCASGTVCEAGRCVAKICAPGSLRCDGDALEYCTPDGEQYALVQVCPSHCDRTLLQCKAPICTPFSVACTSDGLGLSTCDSFGASFATTPCLSGQVCQTGRCVTRVCAPGTYQCAGDASELCSPAGDAWLIASVCASHCDSSNGRCKAPVCTPFSAVCSDDHTSVLTCDSFGATQTATPCGSAQTCDTGRCVPVICSPGATRCASGGASIEQCNSAGTTWQPKVNGTCSFGCAAQSGTASCLAAACAVGDLRCSPVASSAIEECLPDRTGWGFVGFCATGCSGSAPGVSPRTASCNLPVCPPLERECASDGVHIQTCRADGSGWDINDTCPQACQAGACVTSSADCSPGDLRCNGPDVQACAAVAGAPGVTAWSTSATCLAGCLSGACLPGGSCAPGSSTPAVVLHSSFAALPADAQSSLLVYSDPITGADGAAIPDGQLFTAAVTGSGPLPLVASADASPATPGVQVRSSGGAIRFAVRAPSPALPPATPDVPFTVTATLTTGPSCAGTLPLTLSASSAAAGLALVAEDFTTTQVRNTGATTANWDTQASALTAAWPQWGGDGSDGVLSVATSPVNNSPFNLTTANLAPVFAVLGLGAQAAFLDGTAQGLSGGDEVILWDAQGSTAGSANAGTYELLTVAAVSGSRVDFTQPVHGTYGAAADQDVALQRIVLQRVPHFSTLSVGAGAVLTANGWDGTKGGLLFIRVSGTAAISGDVSMDGKGFRGGAGGATPGGGEDATGAPGVTSAGGGAGGTSGSVGSGGSFGTAGSGALAGQLYGLPQMGKLFLGAGGGGSTSGAGAPGGGVVVLSAGSLQLGPAGGSTSGSLHASGCPGASGCSAAGTTSGGGAGGSVWLSSPSTTVGTGAVAPAAARGGTQAGGLNAGGLGRIRIDVQSIDAPNGVPGFGTTCTRAVPACSFGVNGPLVAQSLAAYVVADPTKALFEAQLWLAQGAAAATVYSASANASDPPDFGTLAFVNPLKVSFLSSGSPGQGNTFRWKIALSPQAGQASSVQGLQWLLKYK